MTTGIRAGANASETRLAYVSESAWGTTPSTPGYQNLRYTGESLNVDTTNTTSNEIRADRNVSDLIKIGSGASGGINFELSYSTLDDLLEGVFQSTWSSDVLKNGQTAKSFSLEKTIELGASDEYLRYTGMVPNTFSLDVTAGQIITGSVDFMGKGGATSASAISGSTYTSANTKGVMSAANDFASLSLDSLSPTPSIQTISLNINNNLRAQQAVGSVDAVGIGSGRFEVTGSLQAYFESKALYDNYLNATAGSLSFTLGSVTSEKYTISLPNIKLSSGRVVAGGNDQDVMTEINFQALYDTSGSPANNCTAILTRGVS